MFKYFYYMKIHLFIMYMIVTVLVIGTVQFFINKTNSSEENTISYKLVLHGIEQEVTLEQLKEQKITDMHLYKAMGNNIKLQYMHDKFTVIDAYSVDHTATLNNFLDACTPWSDFRCIWLDTEGYINCSYIANGKLKNIVITKTEPNIYEIISVHNAIR